MKIRSVFPGLAIALPLVLASACSDSGEPAPAPVSAGGSSPIGTTAGGQGGVDTTTNPAEDDNAVAGTDTDQGGGTQADQDSMTGAAADGIDPAIVGLWDFTEETNGLLDEYYLNITAAGSYQEWDYQGDAYDQGQNCYKLFRSNMTPLGNNSYQLNGDVPQRTFTITANGDTLRISNGIFSVTLPRITNITSDGFNEC